MEFAILRRRARNIDPVHPARSRPQKSSIVSLKIILASALCASACSLSANADTVIPTATTANVAAPAPSAIPTDPMPDAARALLNGDYDSAIKQYMAVAATNPTLKCAALYGLGVSNLRLVNAAAAEAALTRALTECPPIFEATLQRAEARRALDKKPDALTDYAAALALRPGLIDSYIYERMALIDGTAATLQKAADAPRYLGGSFALRDQLATALLAVGDPLNAVKQYDLILASATKPGYRAQVEVEAANALIKAGQTTAAYNRLYGVLSTYPNTTPAFDAMVNLVSAGQPVDVLVRTRLNVANSNFAPVIAYLPDILSGTLPTKIPAELYFLLGRALSGTGDYASALNTFQKVRDAYPGDPLASKAALEQGRAQFNAKNYPAAIAAYQAVAANYPKSADAPEALARAGYIAQTFGDPNQAIQLYDQLGKAYPGTDQAAEGSFSAGFMLAASNPAGAAAFFGRVGDAHGLLWQGKMLRKTGDAKGAVAAWMAAANKEPGSFFSLRAHDLLTGAQPYLATSYRAATSTEAERITAESWLVKTFGKPISAILPPTLANDPGLMRGTELWKLGWWLDGRAEFDALHDTYRDDPGVMFQLALYYQGIGAYRSSILAAARVIVLSKQPAVNVPAYLARLAYPIYYTDLLIPAAQNYKVDPLYFASLIRLESDFDARANSSSDARGLTQIVPTTATDIVGHLGWPPNFTADDLFRPFISLRMGAFYIDFVRRYLGGNLAATLAGYNAGPGAASGWLATAGDDLDLLYETITSAQAQSYVQITYENDAVYRALYGK